MLRTSRTQEVVKRREIERELFTFGLTRQDVATALGIDISSVANDLKYLGPFPDTSYLTPTERRSKAYSKALEIYATLSFATRQYPNWKEHNFEWWPIKSNDPDVVQGVIDALVEYLDIKRIRGIADGVASMVDKLSNPIDLSMYRAHRNLLEAVFGKKRVNVDGEFLLEGFLEQSRRNSVFPNRETFSSLMSVWAIGEYYQVFSSPLSSIVGRAVNEVLATLLPDDEKIIRMRFGLGEYKPMTLEDVAQSFNVTGERIRQIEAKTLRQLRNPAKARRLRLLIAPLVHNTEELLEREFPAPVPELPLQPGQIISDSLRLILLKSVEELEISVRSYNCLKNANIETIWDLVQKTTAEMLRTKNFGRKSLREINGVLGTMGLSIGMKFFDGKLVSPEKNDDFEEFEGGV